MWFQNIYYFIYCSALSSQNLEKLIENCQLGWFDQERHESLSTILECLGQVK